MHASITVDRIVRMVKRNMRDVDSYAGICHACGKTAQNVEPDARNYPCAKCKATEVYGAEETLFMVQA